MFHSESKNHCHFGEIECLQSLNDMCVYKHTRCKHFPVLINAYLITNDIILSCEIVDSDWLRDI